MKAEEATDSATKNSYIEKGIYHLRRYYHLLLFQAYLDDRSLDDEDPYSFESFIRHRPVFKTIEKELTEGGLQGLTPIDRVEVAEGMAVSYTSSATAAVNAARAEASISSRMRLIRWSPTVAEPFCPLKRSSSLTSFLVCRSRVYQSGSFLGRNAALPSADNWIVVSMVLPITERYRWYLAKKAGSDSSTELGESYPVQVRAMTDRIACQVLLGKLCI